MNLALTYCWKEWRAQRGLLVAYTLLVFACLCLCLYLAPRHYWFEEGFGVHALSWFVAVSVIGVVAFVVPNLVRAEFTSKEDQFIRRLPGALWPAFFGKLLFLVLAVVTLPLLGLAAGEAFVSALGHNWDGLYTWSWNGSVTMKPLMVPAICGLALLWLPWVWAAGSWTPGGRLSLLASVLLLLLLGVGVFAVERQSPGIVALHHVSWLWWLVPVVGLVVAALSFARGRRGGGPLRSARIGLLTTCVALLPFGSWLGLRAWHYHWPESSQVVHLRVNGITTDDRFALAHVTENVDWSPVSVRVDLQTGEMRKLGGIRRFWWPSVLRPELMTQRKRGRYWKDWDENSQVRVLDLQTADLSTFPFDSKQKRILMPDDVRADVQRDLRANTRMRDGRGNRVWMERDAVCYESPDGTVERVTWDIESMRVMRCVGLGVKLWGKDKLFNFACREFVDGRKTTAEHVLRDCMVYQPRAGRREWFVRCGDEDPQVSEELKGMLVLGLWDADRLLAYQASHERRGRGRLLLFSPGDGQVEDVTLPQELPFQWVRVAAPMAHVGSLLQRDPDGCVWLHCGKGSEACFARVAAKSLHVSIALPYRLDHGDTKPELMSWRDLPVVLVHDQEQIARVNIKTGEREVLFPRK
ncbi:MAG: hypothetical protein ACI89X_002863 [Planctomycetota bacterium]|jgi:hypothetical protein